MNKLQFFLGLVLILGGIILNIPLFEAFSLQTAPLKEAAPMGIVGNILFLIGLVNTIRGYKGL